MSDNTELNYNPLYWLHSHDGPNDFMKRVT